MLWRGSAHGKRIEKKVPLRRTRGETSVLQIATRPASCRNLLLRQQDLRSTQILLPATRSGSSEASVFLLIDNHRGNALQFGVRFHGPAIVSQYESAIA